MNKYITVTFFVLLISVSMTTATFAQEWADNPSMNSGSSAAAAKPATEGANAPAAPPQGSAANPVVVRIEQPAPRRGAAKSGNGAVSRETAARKAADADLRKQIDQWKSELDAKNLTLEERIKANEALIATLTSRGVASTDPIVVELRKEIETIREAQESRDFWIAGAYVLAFIALLVAVFLFFARSSSKNEVSNSTTPASPVNVKVNISVNGGPSGQPMTGSNNVDVAVNGKSSDKPLANPEVRSRDKGPEEGITIPYRNPADGERVQEKAPVSSSSSFGAIVEAHDYVSRRIYELEDRVLKVEDAVDDVRDDVSCLNGMIIQVGDKVADQGKQAQAGFDRLFAQLDSLVAAAASAPATVPPVSKPAASVPECPPEEVGLSVPFVAAAEAEEAKPKRPAAPARPAAATSAPATAPRPKKEIFQILEVIPSILPLSGGRVRIFVDPALTVETGGRIQYGAATYSTDEYEVIDGNVVEVVLGYHPRTMDYEADCLKPIRVSYYSKDGKQATKPDAIIFDDASALGLDKVSDEPASGDLEGAPFNSFGGVLSDALKALAEPSKEEPATTTPKGKGKNKAAKT